MTGLGERAEGAALWRRWLLDRGSAAEAPDALLLAAYADGRLDEAEQDKVEDWLAEHPEALDDVLAAAKANAVAATFAPERIVFRAAALVSGGGGPATLVPFPSGLVAQPRQWRSTIAWAGLAASLLLTSLVGFGIGNNAYDSLAAQSAAVESTAHELLDPPSALFFEEDEEPET